MKTISLAVNGSLMRGLALNKNLLDARAEFVREAKTSAKYRLWSIDDSYPAMMRDESAGNKIDLEIWKLSSAGLLEVVEKEPPGLCLGRIELENGDWVFGVLGEIYICQDRVEITSWGGWRNYSNQCK